MKTSIALLVVYLAAIVAVVYGYVHNIYMLITHFATAGTVEVILRALGILAAPLGVVMGYIS